MPIFTRFLVLFRPTYCDSMFLPPVKILLALRYRAVCGIFATAAPRPAAFLAEAERGLPLLDERRHALALIRRAE